MSLRDRLDSAIRDYIEVNSSHLAAFALTLSDPEKGPLQAFSWLGDCAVAAAARLEVWQIVQKSLNVPEDLAGANVEGVARHLLRLARDKAMRPPARSTSPMFGLIEDETRVAWAQVHALLERHL